MGYVLGRKLEHQTLCFSVESGPTMRGTSSVRRVRLRSLCARIVPPMCFATRAWLCLCAWFYSVLESLVADCIGMAASLSSFDVATCVDRCGFATGCCETHCNGCMNVAWAMFWGGSRSTKPFVFLCKVAAADDERYLVCATGAAAVVLCANCSSYVFCNEWLCLCA